MVTRKRTENLLITYVLQTLECAIEVGSVHRLLGLAIPLAVFNPLCVSAAYALSEKEAAIPKPQCKDISNVLALIPRTSPPGLRFQDT